jgi:hypothetical protein
MADSVIKYSDLISEDDTFDNIFENIEELKKELFSLTKIMQKELSVLNPNEEKKLEKVTSEIEKLIKAKKELDRQEKKAEQTKKKLNNLTDKELIAREKLKIANRERVQIAKQTAIIQSKESGQIEKLRAKLSLTTIQWKKLTKEELENSKKGKNLIQTKKKLTDQLKKLEKQTGDTRRNVGNYGDSLGKVGKLAARLFVGRSLFDGLRRIGSAFSGLIEKNKDTNKEIGNLDNALSNFGSAVSNLGVKVLGFVAKPLTLLIDGLTAIVNYFSDPVYKEFVATSEQLKEVTNGLQKEFAKESAELAIVFQSLGNANEGSKEREELINKINEQYGKYLPNLLTEKSSLEDITKAQELANQGLTKNFLLKVQQATLTDVFTNKIQAQQNAFKILQERVSKSGGEIGGEFLNSFNTLLEKFDDLDGVGRLAGRALKGFSFESKKFTNEIRKTDAPLADFIDKIRDLGQDTVDILVDQIKRAKTETNNYNDVIEDTQSSINSISDSIIIYDRVTTGSTGKTGENTSALEDNTSAIDANNEARKKGISDLFDKLEKDEIKNIKDKQERLLAIEDSRYFDEQEKRILNTKKVIALQIEQEKLIREQYTKDSEEYKKFVIQRAKEVNSLDIVNRQLEIEETKKHEQNKLDIRKEFAIKTIDIESGIERAKREQDEKDLKNLTDTEAKKYKIMKRNAEIQERQDKERTEKRKKNLDELTDGLIESSKKIGQAIVDVFEKQSQLASDLVEQQSAKVEEQQQRAQDGLANTLKFEQDQLAKREGERIRAEQKAKNTAKILALFNLVSAYAQSGDANALQRGLVDFALLTALESAFTGFEEGGFTGSDSSNKKVKGVVHANEYVVTASDTERFGLRDKSGSEFGSAMSDYFNQQSPLLLNTYDEQNTQFSNGIKHTNQVDFSRLEHEVRAMRQAFQNQQKNDFDIEHMTDYFVDIAKRVTQNRMTTVTKVRKRL